MSLLSASVCVSVCVRVNAWSRDAEMEGKCHKAPITISQGLCFLAL